MKPVSKYSRKATTYHASGTVGIWILWVLGEGLLIILGFPDPYRLVNQLVLMTLLLISGFSGTILAAMRKIPLEMGLWTLLALAPLLMSLGGTHNFDQLAIFLGFLASFVVNFWYLVPSTRERSGRFV